jgi:Arc/MetJ-type ribon-helix-helix transcriptional regulator
MVALRIPVHLLAMIDACVEKSLTKGKEEPYSRSSFIVAALQERFDKYQRSDEHAKRKRAARAAIPPAEVPGLELPAAALPDHQQPG